jgi:BirA family biotin operon repressor/biotin-[acetyl-CoA-carboxylase] ligase
VDYAIIGIGINCCQKKEDFAEDIRDIAASVSMVTGKETDRALVAAAMMEQLYRMDQNLLTGKARILDRYRENCITIGQEVSLLRVGEAVRHGKAIGMDDEGALLVEFTDGTLETVNSGEVSVRGMYGYL